MALDQSPSARGRRSRSKGRRGEQEICHVLQQLFGWVCRRTQQFSGWSGGDSPDIICHQTPQLFFEVKRVNRLNVPSALALAMKQCGRKTPVLLHRPDRSAAGWMLTIRLADLASVAHAYQSAIDCESTESIEMVEEKLSRRKKRSGSDDTRRKV
jgi:hypothetical protein